MDLTSVDIEAAQSTLSSNTPVSYIPVSCRIALYI